MNILVAFNENYAMPTRVMLKSLIMNNQDYLNIYVLYIFLTDTSIKELSTLNSSTSMLHFIQIDDNKLTNVPVMRFYSKEAYIRLFAHLYLPEGVDKILWLDSDLIINGEIRGFYDQDFNGKLYVAYKDPIQGDSVEKKTSLRMPADAVYINSGVLLMNLKEIREKVHDENITSYIEDNSEKIKVVDQDVFNGFLYDSIKVIEAEDYIYNYFVTRIMPWNKCAIYQNVRIFHYAMERKPWKKNYKYYGFRLWWKYALKADKKYRKQYISIYPSCLWARTVHWLWMITKA